MKKSFVFLAFIFLALFSCSKDKELSFDNSEPLALAPDVSWAVVLEPYVPFRKDCGWEAEISGHCRKGDVMRVEGKVISPDEVWYKFENGWVPSDAVVVYTNQLRARSAASLLK